MSVLPSGQAPSATIPGIEVLRGFAAMAVFACHLAFLGGWTLAEQQRAVWFLASYGWAGVDLFFIISGFVITRSALRLRPHPDFARRFWIHRLARIYPLYLLSLIVFLVVVDSGPVTGPDAWFRILTHLLMLHAYFPSTSGTINPVAWSLGIEFGLYFLAFFLVWKRLLGGGATPGRADRWNPDHADLPGRRSYPGHE